MATKYSDIVKLRGGKPAYNIEEEKGEEWISFIPNEQFNGVLRTVIKAVRGNDIDNHKSFWINGTYGTGKSHASAVITHLLSDPVEKIRPWVDLEYRAEKYAVLRDAIYKLREKKRLLPVKIYGLRGMSSVADFALVMQKDVMAALKGHGIQVSIKTDYESLIATIEKSPEVWATIIANNPGLGSIAPSPAKLIALLKDQNIDAYHRAIDTLKAQNFNASLQLENLGKWLVEIQDAVAGQTDYNGLFIVWDEFTDVMNAFGVAILKEMQAVAEKFMNAENNSFICLVSHPSAFDKISSEEVKQTDGRYHRMKYNMESVSAFKIMSRKFEVVDQVQYDRMRNIYFERVKDVVEMYTAGAVDQQTTMEDLLQLFPLHPGTANLSTYYATVIGSSSRSVFEFLGQNDAIRDFLESEEHYTMRHVVTADYLWDFVLKVFQDDAINYGAVTERFNSYQRTVEHQGPEYMAVFKAILLLNAFNNMSGDDNRGLVTPSENNIKALFTGTQYADAVDTVLEWLNAESIIQRAPGEEGLYSVQFTALPAKEVEEKKQTLRNTEFRYTYQVVEFGGVAGTEVTKRFAPKVIRPHKHGFYSDEGNDSVLASRIKNGKRSCKASDLFFAFLVARNTEELARLRNFVQKITALQETDRELRDIYLVLIDEVFNDKDYDRFIEYMANSSCASSHGFADQTETHRKRATELVKEYIERVGRGNATVTINGKDFPISMKRFSSECNNTLAPKVFSLAPESLEMLREKAPQTFWVNKTSKEIVRRVLFSQTKSEVSENATQMLPIKYLLQDSIDDNMEWKSDVSADHPLKAVFDFVDAKIKNANKTNTFNFAEKFEDLRRPPYGLYNNFASMAAMAFALRPWVGKIFDQMGKPRDKNNLVEDIAELFKVWDSGKDSNKLTFKFQTPEECRLYKALVDLFRLKNATGYTDITSLKDARYAITGVFLPSKGYPLWSLKYVPDDLMAALPTKVQLTDDIKKLLDNIVRICADRELRNPALVSETVELINANRNEVDTMLKADNTFRSGFVAYLQSFDNIGLRDEDVEAAIKFIRQHLQSSLGYWTEEEVSIALKDWYIEATKRPTQPILPVQPIQSVQPQPTYTVPTVPSIASQVGEPTEVKPVGPVDVDKLQKIRERALLKINKTSDVSRFRSVLELLCNKGDIAVIELINDSL